MLRKFKTGAYCLYTKKFGPKNGKRKNPRTFKARVAAENHEQSQMGRRRAQIALVSQ